MEDGNEAKSGPYWNAFHSWCNAAAARTQLEGALQRAAIDEMQTQLAFYDAIKEQKYFFITGVQLRTLKNGSTTEWGTLTLNEMTLNMPCYIEVVDMTRDRGIEVDTVRIAQRGLVDSSIGVEDLTVFKVVALASGKTWEVVARTADIRPMSDDEIQRHRDLNSAQTAA